MSDRLTEAMALAITRENLNRLVLTAVANQVELSADSARRELAALHSECLTAMTSLAESFPEIVTKEPLQ